MRAHPSWLPRAPPAGSWLVVTQSRARRGRCDRKGGNFTSCPPVRWGNLERGPAALGAWLTGAGEEAGTAHPHGPLTVSNPGQPRRGRKVGGRGFHRLSVLEVRRSCPSKCPTDDENKRDFSLASALPRRPCALAPASLQNRLHFSQRRASLPMASVGATAGGMRQGPGAGASFPSPGPVPGPAAAADDAEEPAEVSGVARPGNGERGARRSREGGELPGRPGVRRKGRGGLGCRSARSRVSHLPKGVLLPL